MATTSPGSRHVVARAWLTGVLLCCDAAIVAIITLVWIAQAHGQTTGHLAVFDMFGVTAAAGVVVEGFALSATVAVARGRGARHPAAAAWSLAWLRLAGVLVATAAIAVVVGTEAVVGLAETFVVALAVLDALVAVILAGTVRRLTQAASVTAHG